MSKIKILPCPFCGGENIKQGSTRYTLGVDIYLKCECGAKIQICEEYGEKNLINSWNRRMKP